MYPKPTDLKASPGEKYRKPKKSLVPGTGMLEDWLGFASGLGPWFDSIDRLMRWARRYRSRRSFRFLCDLYIGAACWLWFLTGWRPRRVLDVVHKIRMMRWIATNPWAGLVLPIVVIGVGGLVTRVERDLRKGTSSA